MSNILLGIVYTSSANEDEFFTKYLKHRDLDVDNRHILDLLTLSLRNVTVYYTAHIDYNAHVSCGRPTLDFVLCLNP